MTAQTPAPGSEEEQAAIARYLDEYSMRLGQTRTAVKIQIELMNEHRQALITAAVTGELEISGVAA